MIEIRNCSKAFGEIHAIDHVSMEIGERQIFGLVGTNGAGKSTLLRMAAGVIKPDEGEILVDQEPVYENEKIKQQIFYISDGGYFPQGYTAADLKDFYREYYPDFMTDRYSKLMDQFHLDEKRRISSYSKGMKKQLLVIMGISAGTKYLLCDETFDGLDPVMRQAVKSLFVSEIMNRDFAPVIASHNMRELEDVCDHVGFLHRGGVLMEQELDDLRLGIHKIQAVFPDMPEKELVAELVREKALLFMREEIPHGIAVTVESFKERPDSDLIDISVEICCERKSHKGMIIGKGGQMLKKIASAARMDCEELLGARVNLQCWVKVREDWRDDDRLLDNLGFAKP